MEREVFQAVASGIDAIPRYCGEVTVGCSDGGFGTALTCPRLVLMNSGTPRAALDLRALREAAGPQWEVRLYAEAGSTNELAAADPVRNRIVVAVVS